MKAKVERLRVGLVAGTVLLLAVLVGTLGYSRYQAGKTWLKHLQDRSGAHLVRETDGFTYSQSLAGRTLFTLHAAKAFQHEGGVYTLHDVVITVYGTHDGRADRIYGQDFEWDEGKGIARAVGETEMDLQVSAASADAQRAGKAEGGQRNDPNSVHVKTSGLVFLKKLGVAATTNDVEFRYGGMTCTAKGAEFDSSPSELHLLADVRVSGELRGSPVSLTAAKADFARETNVVSFVQPVLVSDDRRAHAAQALLHLRSDGSVERAAASGGVTLADGLRQISAPQMEVALSAHNQPQNAHLSGGVTLVDDDKARPARGEAGEVRVRFDSQGRASEVTASHSTHVYARQAVAHGGWLERELRGETVVAMLVGARKGSMLQQVHATGSASLRGDSLGSAGTKQGSELKSTSLSADDLQATFASPDGKSSHLDKVHGLGHAALQQKGAAGAEQTNSADSLDLVFGTEAGTAGKEKIAILSAEEAGHVWIRTKTPAKPGSKLKQDEVTAANADHAAYDGTAERLTLRGAAHLESGGTSVTAATVVLDQRSGDAEASGSVVATLAGEDAQTTRQPTRQPTHLAASHAVLHHATQIAEFQGGEGKPAKMWQQASQIEAGVLVLDQAKHTLVARPGDSGGPVHSVFAGVKEAKRGDADSAALPLGGNGANVLRVESREVQYSDAQRQAVFEGPVLLEGATGEVRARRVEAFFASVSADGAKRTAGDAGLPGGAVERVVATGDVRMAQPGRQGSGEQLVYKAADASFVLTGTAATPPRVVDAQQGVVTGASLLFRPGDSTIVVMGGAAGEAKHSRARIDTRVKQ